MLEKTKIHGVSIADFEFIVPSLISCWAQNFSAFFCIFHLFLHFIEKVGPIAFKMILDRCIQVEKIEKKVRKRKIENAGNRD